MFSIASHLLVSVWLRKKAILSSISDTYLKDKTVSKVVIIFTIVSSVNLLAPIIYNPLARQHPIYTHAQSYFTDLQDGNSYI